MKKLVVENSEVVRHPMAHLSAWGRYVHAQHHWHRHWTRPTGAYCIRSKIDTIHALYPNLWLVISDTYAPNAGDIMYECPLTLWNSANIDISEAQRQAAPTMTTKIAMCNDIAIVTTFQYCSFCKLSCNAVKNTDKVSREGGTRNVDDMIMTTPS